MVNDKKWDCIPRFETKRLILRPISLADAGELHQYWSDEEVARYFVVEPFRQPEETIQMIQVFMKLPSLTEGLRWSIISKAEKRVIGSCGFHNVKDEHYRAETGYEIGKKYWGQGIVVEALQPILSHGFDYMGFNRIEAFVNHGNNKSVRVLEKLGFACEGLLRSYEFARGKFVDQYCFSLLKTDYLGFSGINAD